MVLINSIIANFDSSMVNIILPTIIATFHATLADSQWVITEYVLTMTRLFIIFGSIVFTLSSLVCGFAVDLNQLIFFRVLQGFGSSMVTGISTVIIFRIFPSDEIGRVLGYNGSIFRSVPCAALHSEDSIMTSGG
ncbi:MAG: MFS transporter [Methanobacteriota archaeon]